MDSSLQSPEEFPSQTFKDEEHEEHKEQGISNKLIARDSL